MTPRSEKTAPAASAVLFWPYPPSVNSLYRRAPQGGMFKTAKWREWCAEVRRFMRHQDHQAVDLRGGPPPMRCPLFSGDVRVEYTAARPDKRRRDVTNLIKCLDDMCEELGLIENDCQIVDCRIRWAAGGEVENGVRVMIESAA